MMKDMTVSDLKAGINGTKSLSRSKILKVWIFISCLLLLLGSELRAYGRQPGHLRCSTHSNLVLTRRSRILQSIDALCRLSSEQSVTLRGGSPATRP